MQHQRTATDRRNGAGPAQLVTCMEANTKRKIFMRHKTRAGQGDQHDEDDRTTDQTHSEAVEQQEKEDATRPLRSSRPPPVRRVLVLTPCFVPC